MVVIFGATGRTGRHLVEALGARGQTALAVLRPDAERPAAWVSPTLRMVRAHLTRSADVDRCLEYATSVVYLAGSRPSLTVSSEALVEDYACFMNCVDAAKTSGFAGSFVYVGVDTRPPRGWAERITERTRARWTGYKLACERSLQRTRLHYLVLRARALSDASAGATRIRFDAKPGSAEVTEPLPRIALGALIAGAILQGHTPRASTAVVSSRIGYTVKQAVTMLRELAPDDSEAATLDEFEDRALAPPRSTRTMDS